MDCQFLVTFNAHLLTSDGIGWCRRSISKQSRPISTCMFTNFHLVIEEFSCFTVISVCVCLDRGIKVEKCRGDNNNDIFLLFDKFKIGGEDNGTNPRPSIVPLLGTIKDELGLKRPFAFN